jgi:hypothetical protein
MTTSRIDEITVENNIVHVRQIITDEAGKESYFRYVVAPGQDYSQEPVEIQEICRSLHTPEVVSAYHAIIYKDPNA